MARGPLVLTVDVEDWFHVCGVPAYADPASWAAREKRVHVGVDRILDLLDGTGSRATFFVLGWVARQSPSLVRRIAEAGHEVGSHGDLHRRVFEMGVEEFRRDLVTSRETLQDVLGQRVTAFRAPEWSMRTTANPAFEVLAAEGFTTDSSLVPAPPVGELTNPVDPFVLDTPSGPILEVPPLMGSFFLRPAMWGGGVCGRLTRFSRIRAAVEGRRAAGLPAVLYCHPWEFDDAHPAMDLPLVGTLVHFAGRRRTEPRLRALLGASPASPLSSVARPSVERARGVAA